MTLAQLTGLCGVRVTLLGPQDRLYEGDNFRAEIRYATILNALFVICFYRYVQCSTH